MFEIHGVDWLNGIAGAILGVVATSLVTVLIRLYTSIFDFVPRRLLTIGVGSAFEELFVRAYGEKYNDVLMIYIRNHSGQPLYVARAVYFRDRAKKMPLYPDAWRSLKYSKGYELKFGDQWRELAVLIPSKGEVDTYIPLQSAATATIFPVGKRGTLLLEYISDGKTGIHRGSL